MIARIIGNIWKLLEDKPKVLLAKRWEGGESLEVVKKRLIDNKSPVSSRAWRVVDAYVDFKGHSTTSKMSDIFDQTMIDLSAFCDWTKTAGYKSEEVVEAISEWLIEAEKAQVHDFTEGVIQEDEAYPREKTRKSRKKVAEKINETVIDDMEDFPQDSSLKEEAEASLGVYDVEINQEIEGELQVGDEIPSEGFHGYAPANVNNSFNRGFLYYPVQTIIAKMEGKGGESKLAEKIETVVIRSDRTMQRIIKSERLQEGDVGHDVIRLTDGTLIHSPPKPNNHGSWKWEYIESFLNGETETPPLKDCLEIIHQHLKSRIWIPFEADYWLLATTAVCTYVQSIFDSVPLILLVGPAGSGKSELGAAMAEVSANATMIGQVTAPTMMRLIDESGGLCIIDDLESVGANGKNGQKKFSDIAQVLKVSYKKSTATRMVTNPNTRKTEVMNFFGVKIVSNTKGVDDILGSRMLQVHTRHIDPLLMEEFKTRERFDEDTLDHLRNMLHTWAFENTSKIYQIYQSFSQHHGDRDTEISLPLRVIAKLSEDKDIIMALETALAAQKRRKNHHSNPSDMLKSVVDRLIKEGYRSIAITHIMLEMRRDMDPGYDIDYSKEMPGWSKQEWIGRKLRELDVVSDAALRKRVKGKNLRFVTLKKNYINAVLANSNGPFAKERAPESFCLECSNCSFKHHQCEIPLELA